MRSARTKLVVAAAAVLAVSLVVASAAGANGVVSGKTKLKPDHDTFEAFADMGIAVETTGQAEFKPTGAVFPMLGGDIDPSAGFKGVVVHAGGLLFSRADGAEVKFSKLNLVIYNHRTVLNVKASGGDYLRLATLKNGDLAGTDTSFQLKDAEATLSKPAAELLSETFDFPFPRGIPLGTTTTKGTVSKGQVEE